MPSIPEIDIEGAKKHLDEGTARFVDIRDPGSFAEAHIPGAQPLTDANAEEFVSGTERTETVIVYCYVGNSSLMGAQYLLGCGFESVYSMSGGFEAWRRQYEHEAGDGAPPAPST